MSDDFADDDSHPIPRVGAIDFVRTIKGGGAAYGLVIAKPIGPDHRSMLRLAKKIEGYVEDFYSVESKDIQSTPAPGKMWIFVNIHKDSSPRAFEMVREYMPWIVDNGIKLVINSIDDSGALVEKIAEYGSN